MNNIIDVIKARRTTRKYKTEQIKSNELDMIIEAGLYAPSALNQQSWHFAVVQDSDVLERMNSEIIEIGKQHKDEKMRNFFSSENFNVFHGAPTIIFVSGRDDALMPKEDCAAASQNMLIAAESLDIGACWNGFASMALNGPKADEYKKLLSIPEGYTTFHAVTLGYKDARATNASARAENTVSYTR